MRLYLYLLLAVVATTLLSWFLINSLLILLLTGCCLFDGGVTAVRKAFSYPPFLAFFFIFLLEVSGFLHTHDTRMLWMHVERKATLVAIPFVLSSGLLAEAGFRRFMWSYCLLLAGLSCLCLGSALVQYSHNGNGEVFFYHSLTGILGVNAVYFSAYVMMALLFLLSGQAPAGKGRIALMIFFPGMMVLLASKLLLVMLVVIFFVYFRRSRELVVLVALLSFGIAFTNNPVIRRYKDILPEERSELNGVSLRSFIWRNAVDILDERHAWVFGVSAGDGQDMLNERYLDAGMSVGFLDYNFHSEYIEVLVTGGIVGLIVLLTAFGVLILWGPLCMERCFAGAVIVLLASTESILEMQHSVFLTGFFMMVPWGAENAGIMRDLHYSKISKHGIWHQHIWRSGAGKRVGRSARDSSADAGNINRGAAGG